MIRIANRFDECKALWDVFSPCEGPWDDWNLMLAFHDEHLHEFHFMLHETDGKADGLVPLVHDAAHHRFMLIAGSYPDGRILWLRQKDFPAFFEAFPDQTVLFDLAGSWVDAMLQAHPQFEAHVTEQDQRYFLKPAAFGYDYNNRGKLVHVETIQEACRLRVDEISYMTGMQWKANWKMNSQICRTLRKPPAPW